MCTKADEDDDDVKGDKTHLLRASFDLVLGHFLERMVRFIWVNFHPCPACGRR
jgi:hypothetical protein